MMFWRRLDRPGHDAARLLAGPGGCRLMGGAVFADAAGPCHFEYAIDCDAGWRTVSARVTGWIGANDVNLQITAESAGRWRLNGAECAAVAGCVDLDLSFSPATNLLAIRRLDLAAGASGTARAAWLTWPGLTLEPLDQVYRRTGETRYDYESGGGAFTAVLQVNGEGFVTDYPGLWTRDDGPPGRRSRA